MASSESTTQSTGAQNLTWHQLMGERVAPRRQCLQKINCRGDTNWINYSYMVPEKRDEELRSKISKIDENDLEAVENAAYALKGIAITLPSSMLISTVVASLVHTSGSDVPRPYVPAEKRAEWKRYVGEFKKYYQYLSKTEEDFGIDSLPNEVIENKRGANLIEIGGVDSLRNKGEAMREIYMSSNPGDMELATNHNLHSQLEDLGRYSNDDRMLKEILDEVEYRIDNMKAADAYLENLGLRGLNGQTCAEWEYDMRSVSYTNQESFTTLIIAAPPTRKGSSYLIAELCHSDGSVDPIRKNIADLIANVREGLFVGRERLKLFPAVRNARKRVKEAWGSQMRHISPEN
ncbi:hypothetical protein V8E51_015860 [Hyaloscypha variabilis]